MYRTTILACLALLFVPVVAAQSKIKPLDDAALETVTAGGISASLIDGVLHFEGQAQTPTGAVAAFGTLTVLKDATQGSNPTQGSVSLLLSDNAQQNLKALVNINAVNSKVTVLLNLTVLNNSTVGVLNQSNGH